ncbi:MAG: AEC family transporter [Microbacteriaceae bacterium]
MLDILNILLPLFLIIAVGFAASYSRRFQQAASPINSLVFYIALPALLFMAVVRDTPLKDFPGSYLPIILITIISTSLILFALIFFTSGRVAQRAAQVAMGGAYGNVVYFAIPIALGVLGPGAAVTIGIGQMVHNLFYMILYPVVVSLLPGGHRVSFWSVFKRALLLNPVAMSILLGLAFGYSGLELPNVLAEGANLVGQIATPGALFSIGLSFRNSFQAFKGGGVSWSDLLVSVFGKLVLLPLVTLAVVNWFFADLNPLWAASLIVMAAMPTSTTAYLTSEEYDEDASLLAATVVVTSMVSIFTIPLFLLLL